MKTKTVWPLFGLLLIVTCSWTRAQVTIPLELIPVTDGGSTYNKLGIWVGLGGDAPKLYEFDTGSAGFYAANTFNNYTPITGPAITQSYGSGTVYTAQVVTTSVSLYGAGGVTALPVASVNANIGQITSASGGSVTNWAQDVADGSPPPLDGNFWGDFGIGLETKNGLFGILPQLQAGLSNGFIVRMNNGQPTLQIGLTAQDKASFNVQVKMNPSPAANTGLFPNSNYSTYSQELIDAIMTLTGSDGSTAQTFNTSICLDTGNPTPGIHTNDPALVIDPTLLDEGLLATDTNLQLSATGTNGQTWNWNLTAGGNYGQNLVYTESDANKGYINTSLVSFNTNDIMFDVEDGLVGLQTVPEPSTWLLLILAGLMMGLRSVRLRTRSR